MLICRKTRRVMVSFEVRQLGKLARAALFAIITCERNFSWASITPTRVGAAPRVLLKTINVPSRACFCTQVSGVILTTFCLTKPVTPLGLISLRSVLHNGCRQGPIPRRKLFGKKFRCLFVLIVGCAKTRCLNLPPSSVRILITAVRKAPLALVGLV